MVAEHPGVVGKLDELADPPQGCLGLADEVLVADLEVVVEIGRVQPRRLDPSPPAFGDLADRRLLAVERALGLAQGDVAAIADQVDEARLGQGALDPRHRSHVARRLVAPARLALLLGVEVVEDSDRVGGIERLDRLQALEQHRLVEAEVAPARVVGSRLDEPLAGRVVAPREADHLGDEVGLRRDRQLRVGVEHQAQQGRARAVDADDERRRRALRLARAGGGRARRPRRVASRSAAGGSTRLRLVETAWLGPRAVAGHVAELAEQLAGDRLEQLAVGAVHALAPAAHPARVRGRRSSARGSPSGARR